MSQVTGGATDISEYFQMRLLAGGDATGLTIGDFDLSYTRSGVATSTKADAVALAAADTAHTDNRGIEVDPTDCPGLHRFDFPDAAFAAGVKSVILTVKHASCFTESKEVLIDAPVDVTKVDTNRNAAINLKQSCLAIATGTVATDGANSATSFQIDTTLGAKAADYFGNGDGGMVLAFVAGTTNEWLTRRVTGFNAATDFITVEEAFADTPADDDAFTLLGRITELS